MKMNSLFSMCDFFLFGPSALGGVLFLADEVWCRRVLMDTCTSSFLIFRCDITSV